MAKPCKYRLPGQDTWMSEDEFKKSLADGLLDKFILDDKASIPSLRGFKADATAAQKFRAPVAEAAPIAKPKEETTVEIKNLEKTVQDEVDNQRRRMQYLSPEEYINEDFPLLSYQGQDQLTKNEIDNYNKKSRKINEDGSFSNKYGRSIIEYLSGILPDRKLISAFRKAGLDIPQAYDISSSYRRSMGLSGYIRDNIGLIANGYDILSESEKIQATKILSNVAKDAGIKVATLESEANREVIKPSTISTPTETPKTETAPVAETKVNAVESGADMLDKMSEEERDDFMDDWFNDRIPRESLPGGFDAVMFSEARKVAPKPMTKPKRLTMDNAFELSNFHGFVINIDGEIYGLDKVEDPDATSDAEDRFGDPKEYVWTYSKIKDGDNAKSVETYTSDIDEVIDMIKSSQKTKAPTTETKAEPTTKTEEKLSPRVEKLKNEFIDSYNNIPEKNTQQRTKKANYIASKESSLDPEERKAAELAGNEIYQQRKASEEAKATKAETKPATEKVERKGPVEVEAETKRGTKVTYKAEVSADGKTASVQQTYEAPFGGQTEGPRFANLPIKTDANGNRYVETKNETRVYVDRVKEAPKAKEAPKQEAEAKRATVKIYAREPKLDDRGMPIISDYNKEVEFTKNNRAKEGEIPWETIVNGKRVKATEDQAKRAEKALQEQQKEDRNARERENRAKTREKIEKAFDSLKIDTKGKAISSFIPPRAINRIINLTKDLVLLGYDVTTAIKQATSSVIENLKSNKLISDEQAEKINEYANSDEFVNKVKEATGEKEITEEPERVSGIKKALTSKESKAISDSMIDKMSDKEILEAGENAVKDGTIDPEKIINSIISGKGRNLEPIETAAMVYYKTNLDNQLQDAYDNLSKVSLTNNTTDILVARSEISKLEEKVMNYDNMANITGYLQGRSFRLRRLMLNSEYDLVKQKAKIRAEYKGKIPEDVERRLEALDKKLKEVTAKLIELEKEKSLTESEEVIKNIKETKEPKEKTSFTSKDGKIKISSSEIREAVLNGANSIEEVIDAVRDSVKKQFPKATDRQIRDAITNYGRSQSQTKDDIQKAINGMKRVGKRLSELEDIQNGIKKIKNKNKTDIPTQLEIELNQREKELKEKIKEELSKIPLTDEEIADLQAEKLQNFKKRAERSIEDFQKRIKNGDFKTRKTSPLLDLDAEARKLNAEKERIKFEFEKEKEKAEIENRPLSRIFIEGYQKLVNLPRAIIASLDFGAPFMQGLIYTLTNNPIKTSKLIRKQFEYFRKEDSYNNYMDYLKSSEEYPLIKASGLYISEPSAKLSAAEEAFMSDLQHKIPFLGKSIKTKSGKTIVPGLNLFGRSERGYTGFLNNLRVQAFLDGAEKLADLGYSPKNNIDVFKDWANYVNNSTMRGSGGRNSLGRSIEGGMPTLQKIFFSPRMILGTINTVFNPYFYIRLSPPVRKMALKRTGAWYGIAASAVGLAAFIFNRDDEDDASVELDPRSSDFGKIRYKNLRINPILGPTQPYFAAISKFITNEKKSSETKEIEELGTKYGGLTRGGVISNLFVNKFSPITRKVYEYSFMTEKERESKLEEGETQMSKLAGDLTVPIFLQDVGTFKKEYGFWPTVGLTFLSINGIGVQSYDVKAPKPKSNSLIMDEFEDEFGDEIDFQKEFEDEFKFD